MDCGRKLKWGNDCVVIRNVSNVPITDIIMHLTDDRVIAKQ